jgi:hypothetical protein
LDEVAGSSQRDVAEEMIDLVGQSVREVDRSVMHNAIQP